MKQGSPFAIGLLGRVEIIADDQSLTGQLPLKAIALLAYLAVSGGTHARLELIGLFWPDVPEKKGKGSLRVILTQLRKFCPDLLTTTHTTAAYNRDAGYQLDVEEFEKGMQNLERMGSADLQALLALYRGPFLAGLFLDDALSFEEWVLTQRARLQQLALRGYEQLTDLYLQEGAFQTAVEVLDAWLAIEQWSEEAHRQKMIALARLGNLNAAIAQYDQCKIVLKEALDVAPMPETTAVYERIRLARQRPSHNLPEDESPFIGRLAEQQKLLQQLADPNCRLITLVGWGGMGKTRLAIAVARQSNREQAMAFINGVTYLSLAGVDAAADSSQSLALAIARVLHVTLSPQSTPLQDVIRSLRPQEKLLILDNFEPFIENGTAVLKQILQRCPGIKLLITSREPLQLAAEWRYDVAGLTLEAAVDLFVQTAQHVQPGFSSTPASQPFIEKLCRIVGGTPLAIKLAALWLRAMSLAQIVAETERGFDLLTTTLRDIPPRQRSMRVILDATWDQLDSIEQKTLAKLTVFRGNFTPAAAAAVSEALPAVLAALVDRGLLYFKQTSRDARYHLHELTRQYAASHLAPDEREKAVMAHMNTYLTVLQEQDTALDTRDHDQAIGILRRDVENIAAAVRRAFERRALIPNLIDPVVRFYQQQGWSQPGLELIKQVLDPPPDDSLLLGTLETAAGRFLIDMGRLQTADEHFQRGMMLAQREEDAHLIALTATQLAWVQLQQDNYATAEQQAEIARRIAAESNDWLIHARALNTLGLLASLTMRADLAKSHFESALALLRQQHPQHYAMGAVLNNMAQLGWQMGRYEMAQAHSAEAIALTRKAGNMAQLPPMLSCHGRAFMLAGAHDTAEAQFQESLDLSLQLNNDSTRANALDDLGKLALWRSEFKQAHGYLNASLEINRSLGKPMSLAFNYDNLGQLALLEGYPGVALVHHQNSLAIWEARNQPQWIATVLNFLARVAVVQGEIATASQRVRRALDLVAGSGFQPIILSLIATYGDILLAQADVKTAMQLFFFVTIQPTADFRTRTLAQQQLDTLSQALPDPLIQEAVEAAKTASYSSLIEQISRP